MNYEDWTFRGLYFTRGMKLSLFLFAFNKSWGFVHPLHSSESWLLMVCYLDWKFDSFSPRFIAYAFTPYLLCRSNRSYFHHGFDCQVIVTLPLLPCFAFICLNGKHNLL
ncbi:hypothetical protein B0T09DRAFT_113114 [Sordaria sp. MPI-SDFR-AT-0083]|nr:hypothetical protein B0T09DRAFT_113114 [Sordaria sp. MPI-SDFR-AT-0083]